MGGFGSGRRSGRSRPTVERTGALKLDTASIIRSVRADLKTLKEGDLLTVAPRAWVWTRAGDEAPCARVGVVLRLDLDGGTARLVYDLDVAGYPTGPHDYLVRLTTTPCGFGGRRWWWVCPETGRRCRVLYLPAGGRRFLSRDAYGLNYASQGDGGTARHWRIIRRVERRLKAERNTEPVKPKWMHYATYDRLVDRWAAAQDALDGEMMRSLERLRVLEQ